MNHTTNIRCYFPGFLVECSCGFTGAAHYADARSAANEAYAHALDVARRRQGKDPETLEAHAVEQDARDDEKEAATILFGGVEMTVEHKDNRCERCNGEGQEKRLRGGEAFIRPCRTCFGTGRRIPREIAERQRLTYQQIIDREA
jgi:hypothetical protein